MKVQIQTNKKDIESTKRHLYKIEKDNFSKDYIEFLNEAGWTLERKLPSNRSQYSDLLEDTDWKYNNLGKNSSKHYRRDLDAFS